MSNQLQLANDFKNLLTKYRQQIVDAAGNTLEPDRLAKMMLLAINKPDKKGNFPLLKCTKESLFGAMLECCCYGLYPSVAGHVYFVPYADKAQFILGYRGMIELAYRSERIANITASVIDREDQYEIIKGTDERLIHKPSLTPSGVILGAYCIVHMRGSDRPHMEFMSKKEIDSHRARSASGKYKGSPWDTDYNEMAKKTVMRRAFKWIPSSVETQRLIMADEEADRGEQQHTVYDSIVVDNSDNQEGEPKAKALGKKLTAKKQENTNSSEEKTDFEKELDEAGF